MLGRTAHPLLHQLPASADEQLRLGLRIIELAYEEKARALYYWLLENVENNNDVFGQAAVMLLQLLLLRVIDSDIDPAPLCCGPPSVACHQRRALTSRWHTTRVVLTDRMRHCWMCHVA